MHEKLVKQLRNDKHCNGCPYDEDCNEFDSCLMDLLAADAIEDMNKRITRLEEELRKAQQDHVFVYSGEEVIEWINKILEREGYLKTQHTCSDKWGVPNYKFKI